MNLVAPALPGLNAYTLQRGDLVTLRVPAGGCRVSAEKGVIWLTQEGDPSDIIVGAGESRSFRPGRKLIAESVSKTARLAVCNG